MRFARIFLVVLPLLACKVEKASLLSASAESADVTFNFNEALNQKFKGVGVQWDPLDHDVGDFSDAEWEMSFKRLAFARPSLMRVMVNPYFYFKESEDGTRKVYVWDADQQPDIKFSVQYDQLRKILGFAKQQNAEVFLGQWFGLSKTVPYETSESQNRLLDFFQRLIEVEKFDNIRYLSIVNEPDGWWTYGNDPDNANAFRYWSRWETAARNLQSSLAQRSFAKSIAASGPACDIEYEWLPRTMQQFGSTFGAYDFHMYTEDSRIANGEIESEWTQRIRSWVGKASQEDLDKPLFVTEFGRNSGKDPQNDAQTEIATFSHGVKMADFVVQFIRAGVDGLVVYEVDDRTHIVEHLFQQGKKVFKRWGFWSTIQSDGPEARQSRPWFYPMALAMRYFQRDTKILTSSGSNLPGLRYVAAKTGANGEHIAIMLVNNNAAERRVRVKVPGLNRSINLAVFRYVDGRNLFDADGIPLPSANYVGRNLADGLEVVLDPHSSVVFASEDADTVEKPEDIKSRSNTGAELDCRSANQDGLTCEQLPVTPGQTIDKWGLRWECVNGCASVVTGQNGSTTTQNQCYNYNADGKTCGDAGLAPGERKFMWNGYWECVDGCARPIIAL